MAKLVKVTQTKNLMPGKAAAFDVEGRKIALFNVDGTYYAIDDVCPHSEGPLSEGEVDGTTVACPWHGAQFDLKTGKVLSQPANESVNNYKVVVEGTDIKIEL